MASRSKSSPIFESDWSRREFLRNAGLGGAALMSAGTLAEFLAACSTGTTAPTQTGNVHATGTSTWTAANGDQIFTSEEAELIAPAFTDEIETHTVLGGTGRFEGETGSFTVLRSGDLGTIEGTISSPGSNK